MPPNNNQDVHPASQANQDHSFVDRLDYVLSLARSHRQRSSEIVNRLEEARNAPLNSVQMDTALIRAHAAVKRHFKSTQTEVLFLLTARDSERRALNAIHQQLSDLLVECFGPSFYGSPQPEPGTSSVVVLCIIVIVGLAVLYFGFV